MQLPQGRTSGSAERRELIPAVAVPPGAPRWVTQELFEYTLKIWQPRYNNQLTSEEALGIIMSASQLNSVLTGGEHREEVRRTRAGEQP